MKRYTKILAVFAMITIIVMFMMAIMANAGGKRHNRTLQGDYAFTGSMTCVSSVAGFNPDLTPKGGWYYESSSLQGICTFYHDGTGMRRGRAVAVLFSTPAHAASADFQVPFTYSIEPDGTIITQASGPITGQIRTGSTAGYTYTADRLTLKGLLSKDNERMTLASDEPEIDTTTYSYGVVVPRICQRTQVMLRMHSNEGHNR